MKIMIEKKALCSSSNFINSRQLESGSKGKITWNKFQSKIK